MWRSLKQDYICCTGQCQCSRVSCLMSHVSSPITDKSSSAPLSLSLLSIPLHFLSSGSGQGTPEITRLDPGPASCQLTRKIPGLNWLTLAAKYFAKTDCKYFRNRNIRRDEAGPELRFTIARVWVAVMWLPRRNNLRYLMANSHIDPRKPGLAAGASPPGRAGQAASRHKICKQPGPSQCLQKVWYSQSFVCVK